MRTLNIRSLVAGACVAVACSDLTKVENQGIVEPSSVANPVGALAQHAGATRVFVADAITAISTSAMFSDEWVLGDFPGNSLNTNLDARRPATTAYPTGTSFTNHANALTTLKFAKEALEKYAPTPGSRVGQMLAYTGYVELFLAEQFCNGIPFSSIDATGQVTLGAATSRDDTYRRAIAHFDSAIAVSADSARVLNFARVGKARALVGLARFSDAAAAVTAVPTSFAYNLEILGSLSGAQNTLFTTMNGGGSGLTTGRDGGNGIDWIGANDPRVKTSFARLGTGGTTPIYLYASYNSLGAPISFATGVEARLYQAEAALQANRNDAATTGTGWLGILNTLRATAITPAMPALADPGTFDARVDLLFREKAFWTFLTAQRMGDLRRLVRQYGRAPDKVFPTGMYKDGSPVGTEMNLATPLGETPNTNYSGCIDRSA
jgi:hypothetical protein